MPTNSILNENIGESVNNLKNAFKDIGAIFIHDSKITSDNVSSLLGRFKTQISSMFQTTSVIAGNKPNTGEVVKELPIGNIVGTKISGLPTDANFGSTKEAQTGFFSWLRNEFNSLKTSFINSSFGKTIIEGFTKIVSSVSSFFATVAKTLTGWLNTLQTTKIMGIASSTWIIWGVIAAIILIGLSKFIKWLKNRKNESITDFEFNIMEQLREEGEEPQKVGFVQKKLFASAVKNSDVVMDSVANAEKEEEPGWAKFLTNIAYVILTATGAGMVMVLMKLVGTVTENTNVNSLTTNLQEALSDINAFEEILDALYMTKDQIESPTDETSDSMAVIEELLNRYNMYEISISDFSKMLLKSSSSLSEYLISQGEKLNKVKDGSGEAFINIGNSIKGLIYQSLKSAIAVYRKVLQTGNQAGTISADKASGVSIGLLCVLVISGLSRFASFLKVKSENAELITPEELQKEMADTNFFYNYMHNIIDEGEIDISSFNRENLLDSISKLETLHSIFDNTDTIEMMNILGLGLLISIYETFLS